MFCFTFLLLFLLVWMVGKREGKWERVKEGKGQRKNEGGREKEVERERKKEGEKG